VVCREHQTESRYSDYKKNPVCICSLRCPEPLACFVCQAARATSAAPTYFPIQKIDGRSFADGGIEFNNPSYAIYYHYSEMVRVGGSQRTSIASNAELFVGSSGASHGDLDFSRIRIINLGTGTEPTVSQISAPGFFAKLLPAPLRMAAFLKRTLTKTATTSERVAGHMRTLARVSELSEESSQMAHIKYERFSENSGICYIELDKYEELDEIKAKTRAYLRAPRTRKQLKRVAAEIARDHLDARLPRPRPATLTVPGSVPSNFQIPSLQSPQSADSHSATPTPSTARVSAESSGANSTLSEPSKDHTDGPSNSTPIIPARTSADINGPAESMVHSAESEIVARA
jgi:hypothetical protein